MSELSSILEGFAGGALLRGPGHAAIYFPYRLRAARVTAGFERDELAAKLVGSVTARDVQLWEHGDAWPTVPQLVGFAAWCCVSVDWLIGRDQ